jgi:hypothetical protein
MALLSPVDTRKVTGERSLEVEGRATIKRLVRLLPPADVMLRG